jgi:membrane protease YdiL (CAAX protease family)
MPEAVSRFAKSFVGLVWRLAVYFVVLIAGLKFLSLTYGRVMQGLGLHFAQSPAVKPAEAVGLGQARLLFAAVLAWLFTAHIGRDRLGPILPLRASAAAHLLQGVWWGIAGVAATLGAIACFGGYRVSGIALTGAALAYYLPLWLAVAVVNGLAENLAVMGYPLFRLASDTGWVPASILVSVLFAVAHLGNPGENPLGIAQVFLIGMIFATTIWLTGDLWLSVGIHAGTVLAEDLIFSVPDSGVVYTGHLLISRLAGPAWLSGGDAGPEGSVLALPVFAAMFVLLWIVYRRRPVRPQLSGEI